MPSSPSQNPDEPSGLLHTLASVFSGVLFVMFLSRFNRHNNNESETVPAQNNTAHEAQRLNNGTVDPIKVAIESFPLSRTTPEQRNAKKTKKKRRRVFGNSIKIGTVVLLAIVAFINSRQLSTQIHSMQIEYRPWIAAVVFQENIHWPVSKPYFWEAPSFRNVGKTPALNLKIRVNYRIFEKAHVLTLSDIEYRNERNDDLETNAVRGGTFNPTPIDWSPEFFFKEKRDEISDTEWKGLLKGEKVIYIFHLVTYTDVFHRRLETHFCMYYPKTGLIPPPEPCVIYNDTTSE